MSNCAKSTRPAPAPTIFSERLTTGEDRRRGLLLLATGSCGKRTGSRSSLLAPLVMACAATGHRNGSRWHVALYTHHLAVATDVELWWCFRSMAKGAPGRIYIHSYLLPVL